jgi:hypothetical protein
MKGFPDGPRPTSITTAVRQPHGIPLPSVQEGVHAVDAHEGTGGPPRLDFKRLVRSVVLWLPGSDARQSACQSTSARRARRHTATPARQALHLSAPASHTIAPGAGGRRPTDPVGAAGHDAQCTCESPHRRVASDLIQARAGERGGTTSRCAVRRLRRDRVGPAAPPSGAPGSQTTHSPAGSPVGRRRTGGRSA